MRQGFDDGMIEIFNADRLLGDLGHDINNFFNSDWLISLLNHQKTDLVFAMLFLVGIVMTSYMN